MLSTTDQRRPLSSILFLCFSISSTLQTAPVDRWCRAETMPVAPACLTSCRETGSLAPYQRQVCSRLFIIRFNQLTVLGNRHQLKKGAGSEYNRHQLETGTGSEINDVTVNTGSSSKEAVQTVQHLLQSASAKNSIREKQ